MSKTILDQERLAVLTKLSSHEGLGWIDEFDPKTGRLIAWAADPVSKKQARGVFLIVDDQKRIQLTSVYGSMRPDVGTYFSNTALTETGISAAIPVDTLSRGSHSIELAVVSEDEKGYYLVPGQTHFIRD